MPTSITLLTDITRAVRSAFGGQEKTHTVVGNVAAVVDLADGNVQTLILEGDTTLTLVGAEDGVSCSLVLKVRQDGVGEHALTLPAALWPGGNAPNLPDAPGTLSKLVFETTDGGVTWEGNVAGMGYA